MKRIILIHLCLFLFPALASAIELYDSGTPGAYIKQQPVQGVYLGQMMRAIGLKPDWTNRSWIQMIHEANPNVVDSKGEILAHDGKLIFPVAALKTLRGYQKLDNQLVPVQQEPEPVVVQQTPEPVVEEPQPEPPKEEEPQGKNFAFDFSLGFGQEELTVDNGFGSNSTLYSSGNFFATLGLQYKFNENQQMQIAGTYQFKEYEIPASIGLEMDQVDLITFQYSYGYRLFRNFYARIIGISQNRNFAQFNGNLIDMYTIWIHSWGLQVDTPLFMIGHKQLVAKMAGLYSVENSTEFEIDGGFLAKGSIEFESQDFESGYLLGLHMLYHEQIPAVYTQHSSLEFWGSVGYRF